MRGGAPHLLGKCQPSVLGRRANSGPGPSSMAGAAQGLSPWQIHKATSCSVAACYQYAAAQLQPHPTGWGSYPQTERKEWGVRN